MDSRSIKDQELTKRHWEARLSEGNVRLFPDLPQPTSPPIQKPYVLDPDDVNRESIANLAYTKQHWEQVAADSATLPKKSTTPTTPKGSWPSEDANTYQQSPSVTAYQKESSIERDIRLTQEREAELQQEKGHPHTDTRRAASTDQQLQDIISSSAMPIHKIPPLVKVEKGKGSQQPDHPSLPPSLPLSPPPDIRLTEMTEVDRDSEMWRQESIIEKEIRENREKEKLLREEGKLKQNPGQVCRFLYIINVKFRMAVFQVQS